MRTPEQYELLQAIKSGILINVKNLNIIHKKRYLKKNIYILDTIDDKTLIKYYYKLCIEPDKSIMSSYLYKYLTKKRGLILEKN